MANALPPGFQGTDFSQWGSWQPITIDGLPYYQVPGHDQYVFDPYDGPYGSIKINPKYVEAAYNAENPEPGLVDQIVPAIGTIGGLYAAKTLFGPESAATATGETGTGFFSNLFGGGSSGSEGVMLGDSAVLAQGTELGSSMLASSTFDPATANVADIFSQGGTTGGMENSLGSATPYLGAAGAAYGAYNMYEGLKEGDMGQTGMGAAGLGLGINAMGYALGPWGWGALAAATLASQLTKHESTRDVAKKHTKSLMGQGKDDATWQNYVAAMRKGFDKAPADPSKPFAGKYKNWKEYEAAGLEAPDLTGVYGNLKTFGPEWAKLGEEQRVAVTQGIINAGLYKSKKGEVEITDPEKAKTIYDAVLSGAVKPESNKPVGGEEVKRSSNNNNKQAKMGVPLMPMPQRQMLKPVGRMPQRQMPTQAQGDAEFGKLTKEQQSFLNAPGYPQSFGQAIASRFAAAPQAQQDMRTLNYVPGRDGPPIQQNGMQLAGQIAGQPQMQKLAPRAQPQTDTADWMMKLRQRAMAQPQAMMGQAAPIYSRG